ncbi:MAG TPA: DNA primase [Blastocatellia bacterium]|nr:DNA primase [Blastocatellia bacterium]
MRLPRGFADDVKNQSDIVRVISDYVSLKKRGANYMACCPFHSEKTPSFSVSQPKGLYKCFGCGAGGSVFDFVMRIEGCQFPEAVRIVAEKSGIPIPAVDETEDYKKTQHDREVVLRLNDLATQFFEMNLLDEQAGAAARAYVESRGISDETRALFRLGYAPDSWDALINFLRDHQATDEDLTISGLVVNKETGGFYDRFRGRLMFPIADSQGRVIAFGGRVMGEGEPKYLNSPETTVYTKGRNLYGLAYSKNDVRQGGYAILVEGYLDCMIPYQAGIRNIVASLGTALTDNQVRLLRRYMDAPQIIVNFDPDSAGQNATMRSIEMLLTEGFKVNILKMPTDDDPDEYVRAYGGDAFRALLKTTQPYIEYIIDMTVAKHDITRPAGKVEAVNAIMPHLARMRDKVARADYADQIADRLKVDSRVIREEMRRVAVHRQQTLDPKRLRAAADVTMAERQLLELMLADAEVRRAMVANLQEEDYTELATGAIFTAIIGVEREGLEPDFDRLGARLENEEERALLPALLMSDLAWAGGQDFETLFKKATEALSSLRRKQIERRLEVIQIEIGQAESNQDHHRVLELFQEKAALKRRKLAIGAAPAEA